MNPEHTKALTSGGVKGLNASPHLFWGFSCLVHGPSLTLRGVLEEDPEAELWCNSGLC